MRIALVDYGAGNLPSVERALQRLGARAVRCRLAADLEGADAIVLPGVGHFRALAEALDRQRMRSALAEAIHSGVPFLGICLGMQALFESSEEAPGSTGLGVFPGVVRALPGTVKLPHMGWNRMERGGAQAGVGERREAAAGRAQLLRGVEDGWFYFAHSYAVPADCPDAAATCVYGPPFAAVVERGSVMGVQFHPEKSGAAGAKVLRNFLEAAR